MVKIKPYQFNHRADFGTVKEIYNSNTGGKSKGFFKYFSLYYAPRTRTMNQIFQAKAAGMSDTITIAVRHNEKLKDTLLVKINDVIWKIVHLSINDNNSYQSYDFLTLARYASKVG